MHGPIQLAIVGVPECRQSEMAVQIADRYSAALLDFKKHPDSWRLNLACVVDAVPSFVMTGFPRNPNDWRLLGNVPMVYLVNAGKQTPDPLRGYAACLINTHGVSDTDLFYQIVHWIDRNEHPRVWG